MVVGSSPASSSSVSSSVSSLSSSGGYSDESTPKSGHGGSTVKFLCSYGGKILPRYPDGKLRYVGGETRVLSVDRSVPFSELLVKLGELCGWGVPVSLRCQLPTEDLDALVSVTSDEDLANLIEEYDLASRDRPSPLKIRAFLFLFNSCNHQQKAPTSPPKLPVSLPPSFTRGKTPFSADRCVHHQIPPSRFMDARYSHHHHHHHQQRACHGHGKPSSSSSSPYRHHQQPHAYLVHHGNHWQ